MSGDGSAPSMLGGHAKYVQGAAEAAIGSLTGSQDYTQAGEELKQNARTEMQQAAQASGAGNNDASTLSGKAEDALGKAVGCEGMQADTETSETQRGLEDKFSTTHGEH